MPPRSGAIDGGCKRHEAWKVTTAINGRHMLFAWLSFFTVCGADVYVRLVASGTITDLRLL